MKRPPIQVAPSFAAASLIAATPATAALLGPTVQSIDTEPDGSVCVIAEVPPGFRHVVLERYDVGSGTWENLIAGPLNGASNAVTFIDTVAGARNIYRITAGEDVNVPPAPFGDDPAHFAAAYSGSTEPITGDAQIGHILNRVAYGPTAADYATLKVDGAASYIEKQLDPGTIDESGNTALNNRVDDLFYTFIPGTGTLYLDEGAPARVFKGNAAPPAGWADPGFDDSAWIATSSPAGYDGGNDLEIADPLTDMRQEGAEPGYYSFYMRQTFSVPDPGALANFHLDIIFDDSFIAYLNGVEVARANLSGTPAFNTPADSVGGSLDNDVENTFDLSAALGLLNPGANTLAIEVHNANLTSSDCAALPVLVDYPDTPYVAIKGARELQHLVHLRGVYSGRQLQAVLGEFWENHFTTDFDKVEDYIYDIDEYRALANISELYEDRIQLQARIEAARIEWEEYEFLYSNALGHFGDLLLYSATSPSMLIYLDNVLNRAAEPNENYAREIVELHAFGADNGYTQGDIEVLAKCFTGWTIRKVHPGDKLPFPDSARTPPTTPSTSIAAETPVLDLGPGWKYFKGTAEPSPDGGGLPTAGWAAPGFDDSAWLDGSTGIGYGDGDDATVLSDMRNNYASVYARREFTVDPAADNLVLAVDYDDGYVAYLNGVEIDRSPNMGGTGEPPAFDQLANYGREAGSDRVIDLTPHLGLLNAAPATNVLALQVHNTTLDSSDVSLRPRVLERTYSADSIAVTDAGGLWTFRFNPAQHNAEAKTLFAGTPHQVDIPAGRTDETGVDDAIEVIDAMVAAQPCAEFICVKLVNRFVSDEISLDTYQARTAPDHLLEVVDNAVAAWFSTGRPGHIGTVMRAVLDLDRRTGAFWMEASRRTKVKNPIEFVNSAFRAIDADIASNSLPARAEDMGMELFQRDDPDGFDEVGVSWTDTQSLLERMKFSQGLAGNMGFSYGDFDPAALLAGYGITTGAELLDHFEEVLFQGTLPADRRAVLEAFLDTDVNGNASPFDSLSGSARLNRVEETLGLVLSLPEFQYQ